MAEDIKLTVDTTEAEKFLRGVAEAARSQFAICRPGDVVMLECEVPFSLEAHERLAKSLAEMLDGTGLRAVMLPKGLRVARINLTDPEKA